MSPQQKDIMDYVAQLKNLPKQHDYFIGFDSDGCVFDTMELKHKECFCPAVIKHMGCQPVSKAAREVWDFVNLYSKNDWTNLMRRYRKRRTGIKNGSLDKRNNGLTDDWSK